MFSGSNDPNLQPQNLKNGVVLLNVEGTYTPPFTYEFPGHFIPGTASDNTRSANTGASSILQINDHKSDPNKKVIRVSTGGFVSGSSLATQFDYMSYGEVNLTTGLVEMKGSAIAEVSSNISFTQRQSFTADYQGELSHYFTRASDSQNGNFNRFVYKESTNEVIQFVGQNKADYNPVTSYATLESDEIFGLNLRIGNTYSDLVQEVDGEAISRFTFTTTLKRG